nr:helix-turn-helix domain-containing protein [Propioniciclava coleopterorum]
MEDGSRDSVPEVGVSEVGGSPAGDPPTGVEWARHFELLADPTRLHLLSHMHLHPDSPVADLARAAGVTRTAASQALRVLREEGWVEARREGRTMRYRLIDDVAHRVLHFMGHRHT